MPGSSSTRRKRAAKPSPKVSAEALLAPEILEVVPDAMVAVDDAGKIVQVNAQAETIFGYSREELLGNSIELLVPERYRACHGGYREGYVEAPKIRRMGVGLDLFGRRRDGSEFPVEISLSPVQTDSGTLVFSAIRDVTERKKIEEDLRRANEELAQRTDRELWESRTRLAAIVDSSEDAIIGKDLQGNVTSWNRGAERMYGYKAEEIIGRHLATIVPRERHSEVAEILEKIRQGESVRSFESVRVSKDGNLLNVSITVSPIRDSAGNVIGASTIARNISDQKRAEDQLRQAQKMEAIGRLAGGVAHDFNNILGIIVACSELLRDRVAAIPGLTQYVENIRKASDRGASLTRQLLAFSKRKATNPVVLDLNERLRETIKLLRPLMGDDVEVVLLNRVDSALIEADPGQIDQIVMNLAVNARDAMVKGGKLVLETAAVSFDDAFARQHGAMNQGEYIMLAVSDTGIGMDNATVARIFEPFFTTKEAGKGTGLGLATVYGIVKQAGGHIFVYSEAGRGTTFKIYLPSAENRVAIGTEQAAEPTPARGEGLTILLVEDDELIRALTRQMLEESGYRVLEASDGGAALNLVRSNGNNVDMILTDVVMKGMSGPELLRKLSASSTAPKVVFMSGYTGELIGEQQLSQPGMVLLEKPFSRVSLLKAVERCLKSGA
ncbi:MAG TPA: PAS domain S-box protein [Terriglobales bacterium]|nr:PAS domain S-box protein [Terriglobales bacterium]